MSVVTDAVLEQVAEWQNRPLDALYPLMFFNVLRVKIRDESTVRNKAVYLALGVSRIASHNSVTGCLTKNVNWHSGVKDAKRRMRLSC